MCQPSRSSQKGIDTRQCASKDAGPKWGEFGGGTTSIGGRKECQRGRWPKFEVVLEEGKSVSESGHQTGVNLGVVPHDIVHFKHKFHFAPFN